MQIPDISRRVACDCPVFVFCKSLGNSYFMQNAISFIKGCFQLTRPVNLIIGFLSIFIGGFVTGSIDPLARLILACISGTLVMAGANVINDVYDLEIDRVNKPQRPLPGGRVSVVFARFYAVFYFIAGCAVAAFIHLPGFCIAVTASFWLYLYSWKLKRTVLWGNFTVAFITGLAFVYGGLAIGRWKQALVVGIFAFFFHFAREIIKDMEDMEGDRSDGVVTLPIRYGIRHAQIGVTLLIAALLGLTVYPYLAHIFNRLYFMVVLAGVNPVLCFVVISMWKDAGPKNLGRLSTLMKADMLVGLIAVYLGS